VSGRKRRARRSTFVEDCQRDWNTIRRLRGKELVYHLFQYYTIPAIVAVFSVYAAGTAIHMLWEGQQPCRLRVCVVLNQDVSCEAWFDEFSQSLYADGKPGNVDLNEDQPFDYDNSYYQVMEAEVMAAVSSQRMDVAVCGEDMYTYLLALNACMDMDDVWSGGEAPAPVLPGVAGLTGQDPDETGIPGNYALDLTSSAFAERYHQGAEDGPLYAVVISNTEHLEDARTLLTALAS